MGCDAEYMGKMVEFQTGLLDDPVEEFQGQPPMNRSK